MNAKLISALVGAIALATTVNIAVSNVGNANPSDSDRCSDDAWIAEGFKGIALNPTQETQLEQLEARYEAEHKDDFEQFDALFENLTEEDEARLDRLEQDYDRELQTILTPAQWQAWENDEDDEALALTPQQEQQIDGLDQRFDAQLAKLVPGWTPEKEEQLIDAEIAYEQKLQAILSADQYQKWEQNIAALEEECW